MAGQGKLQEFENEIIVRTRYLAYRDCLLWLGEDHTSSCHSYVICLWLPVLPPGSVLGVTMVTVTSVTSFPGVWSQETLPVVMATL